MKKETHKNHKKQVIQSDYSLVQAIVKDGKISQNGKKKQKIHEEPIQSIKMVFIGDGNCGKTSALISYTTDNFNLDYVPTIFDTYESIVKKGDHTVKLQLWDTAGQDQYKKLRSLSYPKTDVFLLCFSMVQKKSFINAINKWYNEIKQNCPKAQIIFVGTKIDLISDFIIERKLNTLIDKQKVQKKVTSMGHKILMCSALTQQGLVEVFDAAIKQVLTKRQLEKDLIKKASDMDCKII